MRVSGDPFVNKPSGGESLGELHARWTMIHKLRDLLEDARSERDEAKADNLPERARQLSIVITKLEEAMLWLHQAGSVVE